jgi:hypothetical protein
MRFVLALGALLLVLTACGDADGTTATDPAGGAGAMPTEIPAAPGAVRTRHIATVMDAGSPELCLGPIAESYPPQCHGLPIAGWSWADQKGTYDSASGVRWGAYSVGGTWDGTTFGYTDAVTAALYDPMAEPPPTYPTPATDSTEAELAAIADEVGELPGVLAFHAQDGRVLVDVVYDDGSLQAWADQTYGDGVVVLTPMLLDEGS